MSNITEHDGEEEREGDYCKQSRVDFLIRRDTITVHDSLETLRELVGAMESRGRLARLEFMKDGRDARSGFLLFVKRKINETAVITDKAKHIL